MKTKAQREHVRELRQERLDRRLEKKELERHIRQSTKEQEKHLFLRSITPDNVEKVLAEVKAEKNFSRTGEAPERCSGSSVDASETPATESILCADAGANKRAGITRSAASKMPSVGSVKSSADGELNHSGGSVPATESSDDPLDKYMPPAPKPIPPVILSPEQESCITAALRGDNILITGSAGTGKSTILREMQKRLPGDLPITASTGIAAINVGGMTLHSWAGIGIGEGTAEEIAKRLIDRKGDAYWRIKNHTRLAIDEISMISGRLFNLLDGVFQAVRKNGKPFGGLQLILFGDFLQLPPVIKNLQEEEEGKFAFQSKSWTEAKIKVAMLTKVWRQSDQLFSTALNEIRVGEPSEAARALLNARWHQQDADTSIRPIIVHTHNIDVDQINEEHLSKIDLPPEIYQSVDKGFPGPLAILQKNCLAPETLRLKVGAQVMLLKNLDILNGFGNGSMGTITEFSAGLRLPMVRFTNGKTLTIDHADFEMKDGQTVLASRNQIPLRLAWAITAHKSQGMTLDKIEVHLEKVFEDGQAYVALSRARTADGLYIQSGSKKNIRANKAAVEFYRTATPICQ
jgi:ATP-dependent DNA helicase PIF1